jgi:RNA polymerase sigma-70 factor (ECF subfamily)
MERRENEGTVAQTGSVRTKGLETRGSSRFVELVQAELPGSYRFAGYLLGDAADAEDAICEAISRAWQSRDRLRESERFAAWFGRIVTNVCRDRLRRRHGVRLLDIDAADDADSIDRDPFLEALERDAMGRLVRELPTDQQVVVALRFWRDLTLEEIAERLELPLGTVKSRLHYAIKTLRKELDRQEAVGR